MKMTETGCRLLSQELDLSKVKHLIFDMDGTLYAGKTLFPYTHETFDILRDCRITYTFLTNNSSVSVRDYSQKLSRFGLPSRIDDIYTSSLATLDYLKRDCPEIRKIFLVGTKSLKQEFHENGYVIVETEDLDPPDAVIVAFDLDLTYVDLCKAAWWVKQGLPYIATHPDMVCPTDLPTVLVDCGAVCECIAAATGRRPDKVLGKPDPVMIEGIIRHHALQKDEVVMVGDRLYTDMEMGRRAGILSVLVLSGEATLDDLETSTVQPDLVADNILALARLLQKNLS